MASTRHLLQPKYTVFLLISIVMIALDQITKIAVVSRITYMREEVEIIPGFLSLIHAQNPGAALGFLAEQPASIRMFVFTVFTIIAVAVLLSMLLQLSPGDRFQAGMLALIFAGAVGNAIDRVLKQSVTDFIKVYTDQPALKDWLVNHVGTNEYPSFNVADSAIVVGVGLFLIYYMFFEDSRKPTGDTDDPTNKDDLADGPIDGNTGLASDTHASTS